MHITSGSSRTHLFRRTHFAIALASAALVALCSAALPSAHTAWANDVPSNQSQNGQSVACTLSETDREIYAADGSLDTRTAYEKSLGHESANPGLIEQAQARESNVATAASNMPGSTNCGMPTEGIARVLGVCVEFPDYKFAIEDGKGAGKPVDINTVAASLKNMIDGSDGAFPYESLKGYYQRASYGKLTIECGGVVTYTAKHPRDYYTDGSAIGLFLEVAQAIDSDPETYGVDFSNFDANGDGYVDGFYLVFAGKDTGWGSTWWSTQRNINEQIAEDDNPLLGHGSNKVRLNASTLLDKTQANSIPEDGSLATRTIIHETGHMLGLPDYYRYRSDSSTAHGTGTFDMMDTNQGDQNAFSKWLLGWIDESDITRVYVSSDSIRVVRGAESREVQGTLEQTLEALNFDDMTKTGGFVAVSNDERITQTLFCPFYMLQYDQYAGNQSLIVSKDSGDEHLPSGLRVYRIQAQLNDAGQFEKSNSLATDQHDQFIESLDPADKDASLRNYGNFFKTGSVISPTSVPSTNFRESAEFGYSGICIAVDTSEQSSGTVSISWQAAPEMREFAITTPEGFGLTNTGLFTLDATTAAEPNPECESSPKLIIDGTAYGVIADPKSGNKYAISTSFPPGTIRKNSTCEITFPEGYFITGSTTDGRTYSKEITVPLPVGDVVDFEASGVYGNFETGPNALVVMSNTFTAQNATHFVRAESDGYGSTAHLELSQCTLASDGTTCEKSPINLGDIDLGIDVSSSFSLKAYALSSNTEILHITQYNNDSHYGPAAYLWVDMNTGDVLASKTLASESDATTMLVARDNVVVATPADSAQTALSLTQYAIDQEAIAERHVEIEGDDAWSIERAFNAGNGLIAFSNNGYQRGTTVKLYSENDIASLFGNGTRTAAHSFTELAPVTTATLDKEFVDDSGATVYPPLYPVNVKATENGIYVAYVQNMYDEQEGVQPAKPRVAKFSSDGVLQWNTIIAKAEGNASLGTFRMSIARNGSVELSSWGTSNSLSPDVASICLLDDCGAYIGRESSQSGTGAWIGRAWLLLDTATVQNGDDWARQTRWFRTQPIGSEPQPDPTPTPDPGPTPTPAPAPAPAPTSLDAGNSTTAANAAKAEFAKTGDATSILALLAIIAAANAAIALFESRKRALPGKNTQV